MECKSQALALNDFIKRHQQMWQDEIMNEYPESMQHYPKEWLNLLANLSNQELFAIDCRNIDQQLSEKLKSSSFGLFVSEAMTLSAIEVSSNSSVPHFEEWAFNGIKKKKRHEIEHIIPIIEKLHQSHPIGQVVDIGGGVGHLSRIIAHYANIDAISIDRNIEFQEIGKKRLEKYRKLPGSKNVTFIRGEFSDQTTEKNFTSVFLPNSLCLGLHTCGPLANTLIKTTVNYRCQCVLSFGCCYHHLDPQKDFPISQFYHNQSLTKLNLYALSLATRSHAQSEYEVFITKRQVKNYRYGLHLFLMKHFNNKHFRDVGECPIKTYWEPFSFYVLMKLDELKLSHQFKAHDIDDFFYESSTQKELNEMFYANIIRWQLGRCLEVYLLLDRVLYLEEQGYIVTLKQYFKEALSPRNIGILALLENNYLKKSIS